MSSERIKFSTPLPGEEYRARDLSVPYEAVKVLYEIDFQQGGDKDLCLKILSRVFRGFETITKVVHEHAHKFGEGAKEQEWHHQAVLDRTVELAKAEGELEELTEKARRVRSKIYDLEEQNEESDILDNDILVPESPVQGREREREQEGKEHNPERGVIAPRVNREARRGRIRTQLDIQRRRLREIKEEIEDLTRDITRRKANLKRFSTAEEAEARRRVGEEKGEGEEKEWNKCLLAILMAILRVDNKGVAERQMERMVANGFEACVRGGTGELEFATEVEKVLNFSIWHAKILAQGASITK